MTPLVNKLMYSELERMAAQLQELAAGKRAKK